MGAAVSVFALATPAQAATVIYVALGDSYSAGVGAGSYISSSGSCSAARARSRLWAAGHSVSSYKSVACIGSDDGERHRRQVCRAAFIHDAGEHHDRPGTTSGSRTS
jgi:hypothetical protein